MLNYNTCLLGRWRYRLGWQTSLALIAVFALFAENKDSTMQEIVKYHNDLNKIKLPAFTELEQNLLFGIISRIKDKPTGKEIEISAQELNEFVKERNYTNKELYEVMTSLTKNFFKADFKIIEKKELDNNEILVKEGIINLFKEFWNHTFRDDKNNLIRYEKIVLVVNPKFEYLVNQITANFTRFELAEFIALSGKYTKTLYRLLKQYRQTGTRLFKWDEFLEIMDIPEKLKMCDIDKDILKPALRELTAERNLFDTKRIPFKDLKYTKLDKNQQPNPRGRNKVCFIKFEWKRQKAQEELEAQAEARIAENIKNHIPTSADYEAKQEFENYKGVEVSFYDSKQKLIIAIIKDFDNETNQLLCYDKKVNQNFYIPFKNLQKANEWIAQKIKCIY